MCRSSFLMTGTGTSTLNQFIHKDQFSHHIIYVGSTFIPSVLLFPVDRDQNFTCSHPDSWNLLSDGGGDSTRPLPSGPRCCKVATGLWLNVHFVTWEGRNASTQVSTKPVCGVYHHDCFKNWNGLFIGRQPRQEATRRADCGAVIFIIIFFFYVWQIAWATNLNCSTLVVLCRRQSGVYYFPAAGRIIYEGTLSDYLQVSNKKQVRDIITVIKGKFRKIALSKRSRWKNRFTRREGEKKSEARSDQNV